MRVVNLCHTDKCCPRVEIHDDHVMIGEEGNACSLRINEFEELRKKVLSGEL